MRKEIEKESLIPFSVNIFPMCVRFRVCLCPLTDLGEAKANASTYKVKGKCGKGFPGHLYSTKECL